MKKCLALVLSGLMILSTAFASDDVATQRIYSKKNPGEYIQIETVKIDNSDLVQLIVTTCNESDCFDSFRRTMDAEELTERLESRLDRSKLATVAISAGATAGVLTLGAAALDFAATSVVSFFALPALLMGTTGPSYGKILTHPKTIGGILAVTAVVGATAYLISNHKQKAGREFVESYDDDVDAIRLQNSDLDRVFEQLQLAATK